MLRLQPRRSEFRSPNKSGVYWLEEPQDPARPWALHVIDQSLNHPLHVDVGDFSGDGNDSDVVVGGFDAGHVTWYRFSQGWARHDLPLPPLSDGDRPNRIWNVKGLSYGARRLGILAPVTAGNRGKLVLFEFLDGEYRPNNLFSFSYGHPMDDRIVLVDLDGDGQPEALIPDSGPNVDRLRISKFDFGR